MAVNQYFDESKIIKKNKTDQKDVEIKKTEEQGLEKKEEVKNKESEEIEIKEPEETIKTPSNLEEFLNDESNEVDIDKKREDYIKAINDIDTEEKHIYNFHKENGETKISPIISNDTKKQNEDTEPKESKSIFEEQLLKIKYMNESNIEKNKIEIILYKELIKKGVSQEDKKIYESRIELLTKEMNLCKNKRSILEDDKIWQKVQFTKN